MYLTPTLTHLKVTSDQIDLDSDDIRILIIRIICLDLENQEFSVARSESNLKIGP